MDFFYVGFFMSSYEFYYCFCFRCNEMQWKQILNFGLDKHFLENKSMPID